MKSEALRRSRLTTNQTHYKKKSSNKLSQSPTYSFLKYSLTSSYSEKSLWTHSYKNEPFPKELRKKLWGKKFEFDFSSEEEEEIAAVVEEEEQNNQKKVKRLPHFKMISDNGEFLLKRSRIKSEVQLRFRQKCKSVDSLKCLPQVEQEKKEQDELKKPQRSKLSYFKDNNEFNQRKRKSSDSPNNSSIAQKVQSIENIYLSTSRRQLPEQIEQNQAQEVKSVKLTGSILTAEIQKIIVDELDSRRRKQEMNQEIAEIIEQKIEEDDENTKITKLRQSLEKFQNQSSYLKQINDELIVRKNCKQQEEENYQNCYGVSSISKQCQKQDEFKRHHETPLQRQKIKEYKQIKECSSGNQEDDQQNDKLTAIKEQTKQEAKQESK